MADTQFWFLKTGFIGSDAKLSPLPNQLVLHAGVEQEVDTKLNTQSDRKQRSAYPMKTVYGTESLVYVSKDTDGTPYYRAGDIYAITNRRGDEPALPVGMKEAYDAYVANGSTPVTPAAAKAGPSKPAVTYMDKLRSKESHKPPTPEEHGFYADPELWYDLIRCIENNIPVLLEGPTGCGKTALLKTITKRLKIPFTHYNMGTMQDPIASLIGVNRLVEGKTFFDFSPFVTDIQKPGLLFCDELNRASQTSNNVLLNVVDDTRFLQTIIAGSAAGPGFEVDDDCVIFGAANVGAGYTGTSKLDLALKHRFLLMDMDYMPATAESRVLQARAGISSAEAMSIAKIAENLRGQFKKENISEPVSVRHTQMAANMVKDGYTIQQALRKAFLPLFEGTETSGERGIVAKVIVAR